MAGEALTDAFMLSSATVMIGKAADLYNLNPTDHSIGLVKNFSSTSTPGYTDLTQGVKNQIVYSTMTSNVVKAQMEVYEYTAKNLTYALGLDGSAVAPSTVMSTLGSPVAPLDVSITVAAADGSKFAVGDWITINGGAADNIYTRQVSGIALDVISFGQSLPKAIPAGAAVKVANVISVGSKDAQPFLSAKVVGQTVNGDGIALLFPKIRITNGFTLGFATDNYGNLPLEFSLYDLISTDAHYSDFQNRQALLIT